MKRETSILCLSTKYSRTWSMHPGTLETMTSTETCKWMLSRKIHKVAQKHERRLHQHENVEAIQLLDNVGIVRRLQRKKTFELV
jgi:hypothetical protein